MSRKENVEQVVVADLIIIEDDSDGLGMAGVAAADLLVGGIGDRAAGITARHRIHADHVEEYRFGAPEAPACEDCDLFCHATAPSYCRSGNRIAQSSL